jgi:hypothetical protein
MSRSPVINSKTWWKLKLKDEAPDGCCGGALCLRLVDSKVPCSECLYGRMSGFDSKLGQIAAGHFLSLEEFKAILNNNQEIKKRNKLISQKWDTFGNLKFREERVCNAPGCSTVFITDSKHIHSCPTHYAALNSSNSGGKESQVGRTRVIYNSRSPKNKHPTNQEVK